ncbi:SDR family NAD(P)-dependent oxidoreductase [Acerihabitans arboris]|uniref:Glucose 1-dehydrogenase n=1 Tax=Acerihabitans arboris TaxID=2691583 RepID=A0A845SL47_9GAMM|nr:glucose 1-dehydrogenase [Acerihabitans arboris]NDL63716.1 glucose 1-dehydrogenase [Acerihabitans arboris]
MSNLNGKIAVVTGGNSGIGLAIAQRFVREGAYVFITGRRQEELDKAVALIGKNVEAVQGDVTKSEDLDRLYATVKASKGRLDTLVLSSGVSEYATLAEITQTHYDRIFDLNARAALFTAQKALPLMTHGGSMVLVGSIAGFIGTAGYGVYAASKAAMRSYARTWTSEFADRGIRVNTISPGPIETPMFDQVTDEIRQSLTALIPLGRMGKPEEVAAAALFLASDESSFIAGAELCIDGGMAQI